MLLAASRTQAPRHTAAARTSNSGRKKARTGTLLLVVCYRALIDRLQTSVTKISIACIKTRVSMACCSLCSTFTPQVSVPGLKLLCVPVHLCTAPTQGVAFG